MALDKHPTLIYLDDWQDVVLPRSAEFYSVQLNELGEKLVLLK